MDAARTGDFDRASFDGAWAVGRTIAGWLTPAQARLLWERGVRIAPGATVLEIGSHQGRSTVVLAQAARTVGGSVVAVDPFVEGAQFGGAATRERFTSNVDRAGVADVVRLVPEYSTRLRPEWTEPIGLLYVDGKHDCWTAGDDLRWAAFLPAGGDVLVHDAYSSVGVTLALLPYLLWRNGLAYVGRVGSLVHLRVGRPSVRDRARGLAQLPWFARNVVVKVGLRLLRPSARVFGHRVPADPY